MRYLSVCSGIEAATVAWHHMGWEPVAFSEIEKFPSAVLAHHYPNVPNWGDMTKFQEWPDVCRCVSDRQHELPIQTNRAFDGNRPKERPSVHPEQKSSSCGSNNSASKGTICEQCGGTNIDVLVGGTPCQSFSVAGLRKGLDDPRGNLMLTYLAIAKRYRPEWLVWENVPGVLSSAGGRDFAALLRGLDELGYGWAYRVLDAQYFGVAQRRRRVFVVGYLGNWQRAAAVLFERHSLSGHPAPSRQARKGTARSVAPSVDSGRWWDGGDVAATITTKSDDQRMPDKANAQLVVQPLTFKVRGGCEGGGKGYLGSEDAAFTVATTQDQWLAQPIGAKDNGMAVAFGGDVARSLTARYDSSPCADRGMDVVAVMQPVAFAQNQLGEVRTGEVLNTLNTNSNASGRNTPMVAQPVAVDFRHTDLTGDTAHTIQAKKTGGFSLNYMPGVMQPVAFHHNAQACQLPTESRDTSVSDALTCSQQAAVAMPMQVRRLTPVECERLQGFPDGYTSIPWRGKPKSRDGPRYKALGNSMAVPVMRWIGERINEVNKL